MAEGAHQGWLSRIRPTEALLFLEESLTTRMEFVGPVSIPEVRPRFLSICAITPVRRGNIPQRPMSDSTEAIGSSLFKLLPCALCIYTFRQAVLSGENPVDSRRGALWVGPSATPIPSMWSSPQDSRH